MIDWNKEYGTDRLKLKSYVYFGETDDGILFEAGKESFALQGKGLYPVVNKFLAMLDSGIPAGDIANQVPPQLHGLLGLLLQSLHTNRMLLPVDSDSALGESQEHSVLNELTRFAQDHLGTVKANAAIARFATSRLLLVGEGYAMKSAFSALLSSGAQHMRVLWQPCDSGMLERKEVENLVADHAAASARIAFSSSQVSEQDVVNADYIVIASDHPLNDTILACLAWGRANHIPVVVASVLNNHAICLPPTSQSEVGFKDAASWLNGRWAEVAPNPASLSVMGCIAAQRLLYCILGIESEGMDHGVSVVDPYLEVSVHALTPAIHPAIDTTVIQQVKYPQLYQLPEGRELAEYEVRKMELAPWFDEVFGCFSLSNDERIQQMPLFQFPIQVSLPDHEQFDVLGWGVDLAQAGLSSLIQCIRALAENANPHISGITVRFNQDEWKAQAKALAFSQSDWFATHSRALNISPEQLSDAKSMMLLRLLRYQTAGDIRIEVLATPEVDTYVAQLYLDGAFLAGATHAAYLDAVHEVLGRACSHFQIAATDNPGYWRSRQARLTDVTPAVHCDSFEALLAEPSRIKQFTVTFHQLSTLGLPETVFCGYATIEGVQ